MPTLTLPVHYYSTKLLYYTTIVHMVVYGVILVGSSWVTIINQVLSEIITLCFITYKMRCNYNLIQPIILCIKHYVRL